MSSGEAAAHVPSILNAQLPALGATLGGQLRYIRDGATPGLWVYNGSTWTVVSSSTNEINVKSYGAVGDGTTSDQTALAAAIAAVLSSGATLYWPAGTYVTTATLANFHSVRHRGPGALLRGTDTFTIEPANTTQANAVYVGPTGSNTNDGLTATTAFLTIQTALNALVLWKPLRFGWTVWLAAGTYAEACSLPSGVAFSDQYLTIRGPVPAKGTASGATTNAAGYGTGTTVVTLASAGTGTVLAGDTITFAGDPAYYTISVGDADVSNGGTLTFYPGLQVAIPASTTAITVQTTARYTPTAIIDYPGSGSVGLDINQHNKVKVQDIKFTNWMGTAVTGVNADSGCVLWTVNVHASYCRQGIVGNDCQILVQGGLLHGVDWISGAFPAGGGSVGVVAYGGTLATIGYTATTELTGTIIENFAQAGYEGKARTHVVSSWVTYRSNEVAVWLYTDSRFDDRHNIYRKNELCYLLQRGFVSRDSVLGLSDYNFGETYNQTPGTLGEGNFEIQNTFQYSTEEIFMHPNAIGGLDVCKQHQTTLQTGTIVATLTRLLCTVYAGTLFAGTGTNGKYYEVFLCGDASGSAGTKTVTLRLGGTVLTTLTIATGSVTWTARITLWSNNVTSVTQITEATNATITAIRTAGVATIDTWVDNALEVWTAIPGAADTTNLHEARVIKWG